MGWVFLTVGVCFLGYAGVQLYRYRGSDSWPIVDGVIEGHPEVHASGGEGKTYYAILFYSYSVDGESYSGAWQSPSGIKKQRLLDTITAKLPSGSRVRIRYNPRKLEMSMADIDASIFDTETITRLGL